MIALSEIEVARFWQKVALADGDACWLWTAAKGADGYGTFSMARNAGRSRTLRAHRVAYALCVGPIPAGLVLDHLCRVPLCVNPAHLEAVTQRENILRGIGPSAREATWTHCPRGHEFTPENTLLHGRNRKRQCRTCALMRGRRQYWKRKAAA